VSGIEIPTLIITKYQTANLWNGGKFGFEGSVVSVIFLVLSLVLVYFNYRNRTPVESGQAELPEIDTNEFILP
jgi:hypothetical protein